ncbi:unnamed protein product [Urochloa decumbens]|uniref:Uncharacterized protein n=1 Tax=Urochloa decumbens TaxID=240449 RepID=A0ABC9G1U9_9POAL
MVRSVLYDLHSGPFLLNGDGHAKAAASGGVGVDLSSFRVMCVVGDRRSDRYRGSMFNSRGRDHGSWQGYSVRWEGRPKHFMGHTRASLYWHAGGGTVESLDRSKAAAAEVSSSRLPAGMEDWDAEYTQLKVAAGRDGEARVLAAGASIGVIKAAAAVVHVKVTDTALVVVSRWEELWAHRVDVETGEAELVPDEDACCDVAFPCELPWPPVLRRHRAREQLPVGGV